MIELTTEQKTTGRLISALSAAQLLRYEVRDLRKLLDNVCRAIEQGDENRYAIVAQEARVALGESCIREDK